MSSHKYHSRAEQLELSHHPQTPCKPRAREAHQNLNRAVQTTPVEIRVTQHSSALGNPLPPPPAPVLLRALRLFAQPCRWGAGLGSACGSGTRIWWPNSPRCGSWGQRVPRSGTRAPAYRKAAREEIWGVTHLNSTAPSRLQEQDIVVLVEWMNKDKPATIMSYRWKKKLFYLFPSSPPPFTLINKISCSPPFIRVWTSWIANH